MSFTDARFATTTGHLRNSPKEIPPVTSVAYTPYSRPSDWPSLPSVGPTDQKFAGVYMVVNNSSNFITMRVTTSSGTATIDWGDGSATVTATSGTTYQYNYNYASVSGSPTTRGYKCVVEIGRAHV